MKKILLLIYFISFHVISELTLEITQGTEDPYRVAIIKFSGADKAATDIQKMWRAKQGRKIIRANEAARKAQETYRSNRKLPVDKRPVIKIK